MLNQQPARAPHAGAPGLEPAILFKPIGRAPTPPPVRPLAMAELAGEWTHKGNSFTRRVDRHTSAYLGDDSITMRTTWTILANGIIASDAFGMHDGRTTVERALGRVRLDGDILDLRLRGVGRVRYVVRDWLEGLTITVLKINGPWYADIPAEIRANPGHGWNRDQCWIRQTRSPLQPARK